jgi:hypothetical protein
VKVVETEPAGTVTEVGVVSRAELSETVTAVPPVGAAFERVTVQVLLALEPRLVGAQVKEESES